MCLRIARHFSSVKDTTDADYLDYSKWLHAVADDKYAACFFELLKHLRQKNIAGLQVIYTEIFDNKQEKCPSILSTLILSQFYTPSATQIVRSIRWNKLEESIKLLQMLITDTRHTIHFESRDLIEILMSIERISGVGCVDKEEVIAFFELCLERLKSVEDDTNFKKTCDALLANRLSKMLTIKVERDPLVLAVVSVMCK